MSYKTILSPIGVNQSEQDLQRAVEFARAMGAHLTAFVIAFAAPPPIGGYAETISAAWLEERDGDRARLAEQVEKVKQNLALTGLSHDVQSAYTEYAWADRDITPRALYADLALVGSQAGKDHDLCKRILDSILFQSPTPILFNPVDRPVNPEPTCAMIAWDNHREAFSAVQRALPLLRLSKEIRIAMVDPDTAGSNTLDVPGVEIAKFLARHEIPVLVDIIASSGQSIGKTLRQHATTIGADLVVMGAYSHTRLKELVFGGVTQSMLEETCLPTFLSH